MTAEDSSWAIQTTNLVKHFRDIKAVDGLNLSIAKGEMFALVGPDGAGKTTTIRMLCGITEPTSGEINILGMELAKNRSNIKSRIGYLSQRFSLYGDLSVDENIEFFAEIHRVKDYQSRRDELLEFTRLKPFRNRLAERLSGGMKQKLALACTLVHKPEIILLDEPTTGVDPVSRRDFWRILADLLRGGITIMLTTPYLDEAERCSRVGLLSNGVMTAADTPANVKSLMKGNVIEIICSDTRAAYHTIKEIPDIAETQIFGDRINIVVKDRIENAIDEIKKSGIEIINWRPIPPSLENVFISLIKAR